MLLKEQVYYWPHHPGGSKTPLANTMQHTIKTGRESFLAGRMMKKNLHFCPLPSPLEYLIWLKNAFIASYKAIQLRNI